MSLAHIIPKYVTVIYTVSRLNIFLRGTIQAGGLSVNVVLGGEQMIEPEKKIEETIQELISAA
jgi:hypothetical protein